MKIAHLNTSDLGGAGIAAKNLHLALLAKGVQSSFITKFQLGESIAAHETLKPTTRGGVAMRLFNKAKNSVLSRLNLNESAESFFLKGHSKEYEQFSLPWSELDPYLLSTLVEADIIHLHWVSDGFIDPRKIFNFENKKFVWTLHDMNPFTGGCHHADGCVKFKTNCNYCFQLKGTRNEYLSNIILNYKDKALKEISDNQLEIITPSAWLGNLSKESTVLKRFNHHVIRNINSFDGLEIDINELRIKYNIDENCTVFVFVAHHFDNPRKGIQTLLKALKDIQTENIRVIAIGEKNDAMINHQQILQFGYIKDKNILKELYTLADAFILPSMAENLPNTIIESLLCGTPVIASNVGGIPEQITNENGLLVNLMDEEDWKQKINWFIENKQKFNRKVIRKKAEEDYNNVAILEQHVELYTKLLNKN